MNTPLHAERLDPVHPKLADVVRKAVALLDFPVTVAEGLRTLERQKELWAKGRTAPGPCVTWTMASKHLKQQDGYGHAVDLYAIIGGKIDGSKADKIAAAMMTAALTSNTPIRWGADWNHNGRPHEKGETDSPHFELRA